MYHILAVQMLSHLKVPSHQNQCICFIHFSKIALCSDNFDSDISTQCFVNTDKFPLKSMIRNNHVEHVSPYWHVDAPGDVITLANKHREY